MNRAEQRGAVSLITLLLLQLGFLGGCVAAVRVAVAGAGVRATTAADAAAHAAVAELAGDAGRVDLAAALESGERCGMSNDVTTTAGETCSAALRAAGAAAEANRARLLTIEVGADPRAYVDGATPALFEVVVETEVPGPLVGSSRLCADHQSRRDLCWADAWSAAREAG